LACVPQNNRLGIGVGPWRWALVAIATYLSGLMVVFAGTPRYYWPLQGLLLTLVGTGATMIARGLATGCEGTLRPRRYAYWQWGFAAIVMAACVLPCFKTVMEARARPGLDLERAARELEEQGIQGPLSANHWHQALIIAYHLDTPCVGVPRPGAPDDIVREVKNAGAKTFLLFEGALRPPGAAALGVVAERLGPPVLRVERGDMRFRVFDLTVAAPSSRPAQHPATRDNEGREE